MRCGIMLAFIALFLLACAPIEEPQPIVVPSAPEQPPVEQPPVVEQPPAEQPPAEQPPAEPPEEGMYERPPEEGPSIAKYLNQFRNEVKNYKFTFKNDQWTVEGNHARIDLFRVLQNQYHADFIDTVYLDLERRTAIGVCEGKVPNILKQCALRQTLHKKYAVPYVQFKIVLPEDWLAQSQNMYVTESDTPRLVTDRPTVHLKHQTQTRLFDLFIDPSIGLPIVVIDDGIEHQYQRLTKNQLGPKEKVIPE